MILHATLIVNIFMNEYLKQGFYLSAMCMDGNIFMVRSLIENQDIDPSFRESCPLRMAAFGNKIDVVRYLIKDGRSDPSAVNNYALKRAIEHNNIEMVNAFLMDGRVNPATTLLRAVELNRAEICELLVKECNKRLLSKRDKFWLSMAGEESKNIGMKEKILKLAA